MNRLVKGFRWKEREAFNDMQHGNNLVWPRVTGQEAVQQQTCAGRRGPR